MEAGVKAADQLNGAEAELMTVETFFGRSKPVAVRSSINSESPMTQTVARRDGFESESRSAEGSTEPNSELKTDGSVLRNVTSEGSSSGGSTEPGDADRRRAEGSPDRTAS